MIASLSVLVVFLLQAEAAVPQTQPERKANPSGASGSTSSAGPSGSDKGKKVKVYTFSGLDVEGKLKTPQLLYFLNRVKLEFDTSAPAKRSFMKELERSADDKNL